MPQPHDLADQPGWYRRLLDRLLKLSPAAILVILTTLVVAIGLLLVQASFAQRTARQTANAEAETALALETLKQTLVDAETGQRGYLLTQDPAYLQPYDAAKARLDRDLDDLELRLDSAADPQVDEHLRQIRLLTRAKIDELDQTVRYARNGNLDAAMLLVRTDSGKASMDALRQHLAALGVGLRQRRADAFMQAESAEDWQIPLLITMWLGLVLMVFAARRSEQRRARAELAASHTERLHDLNERNKLLAQELNHRVKNLFSVVLSLIGLASREKGDAASIVTGLSARIHGLSRAHSLAFGPAQNAVTEMQALLANVLEPYQDESGARIALSGPSCGIVTAQLTPLALILHELATNAAKYGALSVASGSLRITWTSEEGTDRPETTLVWRESGGPPPSEAKAAADATGGFGTRMTAAVLRQIDGTIEREWPESGAVLTIRFRRETDPEVLED